VAGGAIPGIALHVHLTPVRSANRRTRPEQVRDLWHEDAPTPAADLTGEQRTRISNFFQGELDNMVAPFPRYWSLLQKRGTNLGAVDLEHLAVQFHRAGLPGPASLVQPHLFVTPPQRLYPEIAELKRKARTYEEDKRLVLDHQRTVLRTSSVITGR